jgi:hypothetical protein
VNYEEHARAAERRIKEERESWLNALRKAAGTAEGRTVLRGIIERCQIFHAPMETQEYLYLAQGKRQVGIELLSDLTQTAPGHVADIIKPAISEDDQ